MGQRTKQCAYTPSQFGNSPAAIPSQYRLILPHRHPEGIMRRFKPHWILQTTYFLALALAAFSGYSWTKPGNRKCVIVYKERLSRLTAQLSAYRDSLTGTRVFDSTHCLKLKRGLHACRMELKQVDFWLRYSDPILYRHINGPLPVEWEVEVFEKYEPPYMRRAGGFILMEEMLDSGTPVPDSLTAWCDMALAALEQFSDAAHTSPMEQEGWFLYANRLFLLNLSTIYTTGFECPDPSRLIPELRTLCHAVNSLYGNIDQECFPVDTVYHEVYRNMLRFLEQQGNHPDSFAHFTWLRDYLAPLYRMQAEALLRSGYRSNNFNDYSLQNTATSLLAPDLYLAQNRNGIFSNVSDPQHLTLIRDLGRQLFYDPILSGNVQRSCASCHFPNHYFADTTATPLAFDGRSRLARNTPSLFLAASNHLLMADGAHFNLQNQARTVIAHLREMAGKEEAIMKRVWSVPAYRKQLKLLGALTPLKPQPDFEHILGSITAYYSSFGDSLPVFFDLLRNRQPVPRGVAEGFNLFMGKAQCGTCHFFPRFNGVKPPFTGSEFEVIGVPEDSRFNKLSSDSGRFLIHPVPEMLHAFRTPGLWNIEGTRPYMHNGVFKTLEDVIDFYNAGGGAGKGLKVPNQTLPADSLHISQTEKQQLLLFLKSLNTREALPLAPDALPGSGQALLRNRKPGGKY